MSQEKVPLESGGDRSYLSELENNRWSPTGDTLFRVCDALGVAASDIIARVERTRKKG